MILQKLKNILKDKMKLNKTEKKDLEEEDVIDRVYQGFQ